LFAQKIRIAFTGFREIQDLRGDGLFDDVVAVSSPKGDADQFEGDTYDASILGAESVPLRNGVIGIARSLCDRRECYRTLSHRRLA
jgi:hypothetical protein